MLIFLVDNNFFFKNPEVCPPGCVGRNCNNQEDLCNAINPCFQKDLNTCSNKVSSLSCRCSFGYSGSTCEKSKFFNKLKLDKLAKNFRNLFFLSNYCFRGLIHVLC